jgi:hypothetical protein
VTPWQAAGLLILALAIVVFVLPWAIGARSMLEQLRRWVS